GRTGVSAGETRPWLLLDLEPPGARVDRGSATEDRRGLLGRAGLEPRRPGQLGRSRDTRGLALLVGLGGELATVRAQRRLGVVDDPVGGPPVLGELLEVRAVPERPQLLQLGSTTAADVGDPRSLAPEPDGDVVELLDVGAVGDLPAHVLALLPLGPSLESRSGRPNGEDSPLSHLRHWRHVRSSAPTHAHRRGGPPGSRPAALPGARAARGPRHPARGALAAGYRGPVRGHGLLLGCRADLLAARRGH